MRSMLTLLLLLSLLRSVQAAAVPCIVESTNQGGGWFSYSFKRGDANYIWRLSKEDGYISLKFPGFLEAELPTGWTRSLGAPDRVYLYVTNGTVYLDDPVSFRLRSALTESTTYGWRDAAGMILSEAVELPERIYPQGGYQMFSCVVPVLPTIAMGRNGTNITASWSTNAVGLKLQENSEITKLVGWSSVTNVPIVLGTNHTVEFPASGAFRFFRLTITNSP